MVRIPSLKDLSETIDGIIKGIIPIPVALGGNSINRHHIKARTISGDMMNVGSLNAIQAKTGDLTVNGDIEIISGGGIRMGLDDFSDVLNSGFFLGDDGGTPKLRIGGPAESLTWDGTNLNITGSITAGSGTIGGWVIGSTDLTHGSGTFGLATTGSVRFWFGHVTPSSAPFQISSAGAITATAGVIGGWTIDGLLGIRLGSGSTERGMDAGSTAFYAGGTSGSAPFRVTTAGAVSASDITITGGSLNIGSGAFTVSGAGAVVATSAVITGDITTGNLSATGGTIGGLAIATNDLTVGTGKKILFGVGSDDYLGDDILHFEVAGGGEVARVEFQSSSNPKAEIIGKSVSGFSSLRLKAAGSSTRSAQLQLESGSSDGGTNASLLAFKSGGSVGGGVQVFASGSLSFNVNAGVTALDMNRINRSSHFYGRLYPGTGTASQSTRYISDVSSNIKITTNTLLISGTSGQAGIRWENIAGGGSAATWGSFTTTNIPDKSAGYIKINIAGTNYRLAYWADS